MNKLKGFVAILSLCMILGMAFVVCADNSTFEIRPESQTINKGDGFKVTIYADNSTKWTSTSVFYVKINKVDTDAQQQVYWHFTKTVASNGKSVVFSFVTETSIDSGTYTIRIVDRLEQPSFSLYATVYVSAPSSINWIEVCLFLILGIVFIIVCGLLVQRVRKTPTIADDIAVGFGFVAGVGLICMSVAILLGWLII